MEAVNPRAVRALVPCHDRPPVPGLLEALAAEVGGVVVVADGMPAAHAAAVHARAAAIGADVIRLEPRSGKGHAIAAGLRALRAASRPPAAVLVVDADGQHPVDSVPRFLAASAAADLVVGNRIGRAGRMPCVRRMANRVASGALALTTRRWVPDSQCGMRLMSRRALHEIELPPGGFDSETRHLKRCLAAGVPVAWVPIPAIYAGEPSAFRPVADGAAVLAAIARRGPAASGRSDGASAHISVCRAYATPARARTVPANGSRARVGQGRERDL